MGVEIKTENLKWQNIDLIVIIKINVKILYDKDFEIYLMYNKI